MEAWLSQLAGQSPYIVIVGVLLASGFGLPLPEDLPLILAGYLCGEHYANEWIMLPACFGAIMIADGIVFWLGHRYGHHIPKLPLLRRFLTEKRLAKTENMFHRHGGKFVFLARFMPGLRTAGFFTAGTFKLAYWKFLLYDGAAAMVSVPTIFLLAFFFADQIEQVKQWVQDGQTIVIVVVVVAVAGFFLGKWLIKKKITAAKKLDEPRAVPDERPAK